MQPSSARRRVAALNCLGVTLGILLMLLYLLFRFLLLPAVLLLLWLYAGERRPGKPHAADWILAHLT